MLNAITTEVREISLDIKQIFENIKMCENCETTENVKEHTIYGVKMTLCDECVPNMEYEAMAAADDLATMNELYHWGKF